jgi:hypothetical protein
MSADQDAFLKEKVFGPVAERVKEKRDSLSRLTRFSRSGIEGWLKVETACALGDCVKKFLNNGPDLQLADELFIELKGATDCNTSYILGGLKYAAQLQYRRIACPVPFDERGEVHFRQCYTESNLRVVFFCHNRF